MFTDLWGLARGCACRVNQSVLSCDTVTFNSFDANKCKRIYRNDEKRIIVFEEITFFRILRFVGRKENLQVCTNLLLYVDVGTRLRFDRNRGLD